MIIESPSALVDPLSNNIELVPNSELLERSSIAKV